MKFLIMIIAMSFSPMLNAFEIYGGPTANHFNMKFQGAIDNRHDDAATGAGASASNEFVGDDPQTIQGYTVGFRAYDVDRFFVDGSILINPGYEMSSLDQYGEVQVTADTEIFGLGVGKQWHSGVDSLIGGTYACSQIRIDSWVTDGEYHDRMTECTLGGFIGANYTYGNLRVGIRYDKGIGTMNGSGKNELISAKIGLVFDL